jgi:hypothetical protein
MNSNDRRIDQSSKIDGKLSNVILVNRSFDKDIDHFPRLASAIDSPSNFELEYSSSISEYWPSIKEKDLRKNVSGLIEKQATAQSQSVTSPSVKEKKSSQWSSDLVDLEAVSQRQESTSFSEKAIYQRSSDLIDQQGTAQLSPKLLNSCSINEKAIYQRSSDLIDQYETAQSIPNRLKSPPGERAIHQSESALVDQRITDPSAPHRLEPVVPREDVMWQEQTSYDVEHGVGRDPNEAAHGLDYIAGHAGLASPVAVSRVTSLSDRHMPSSSGSNKAALVPRLNNDGSRAPRPGASFVRSRPIGIPSSQFIQWYRREHSLQVVGATFPSSPVTSSPPVEPLPAPEEAAPDTNAKSQPPKRCYYLLAAVLACILIAAAVGITFAIKGKHSGTDGTTTTRFSPFTKDCSSLDSQSEPHVLSQCYCNNKISTVASDIVTRYDDLSESFVRDVYPSFNESLDSCSPSNQALLWLASGDGGDDPSTDESRLRQRYSLAVLFSLWNGLDWSITSGWLSSENECTWFGIACNTNGTMVTISLSNNSLVGELAPATALLTSLVSLMLDGNDFRGSVIPSEINKMSKLQHLELTSTGINGTIPHQLFDLNETLQYVNIAGNSLTGTIPTLITALGQLRKFHARTFNVFAKLLLTIACSFCFIEYWIAGSNMLNGTLPTELGSCANLQGLEVESNNLVGIIPSQVSLLVKLGKFFNGGKCQCLSGSFPNR